MSVCPHCHAATPPDAATCPQCGQALAATAASAAGAAAEPELPAWLRELRPAAPAGEATAAAPAAVAPAARAATPAADAAPRSSGQLETSALISEDDLPAWLRTWAANEDAAANGAVQDQSWMLGGEVEEVEAAPEIDVVEEAPHAWHVPAAVAEPPPSRAATAFGSPRPEARPAERLLAPRAPDPEPAPAESRLGARLSGQQAATPPMPLRRRTQIARSRSRAAALATAALATAAVIFLISLVFFLVTVGPFH
ncbi:MAG TPA: zinc ribbon domain-containing protein [Thermomicrobiales bacterium]|nr:zinc ribbon domain-containing protein [Thermomicrobiales bacterium]